VQNKFIIRDPSEGEARELRRNCMETQHNCEAKKKLRILDNELEVEKQKPSFNNDFTFKNEDYALESK